MKDTPTSLGILTLLIAIPVVLISGSLLFTEKEVPKKPEEGSSPAREISGYLSSSLPLSDLLRQLGVELRLATGETKQDHVYISSYGFLQDSKEPQREVIQGNNKKIIKLGEYLREGQDHTSLGVMVAPSATAVLQHQLPRFSTPVNQRLEIDNIGNQLTGKALVINPYNILLEQKEKYIYYRTEDTFTSLGGYYLYAEIMRRMLPGEELLPLESFDISYGKEFYGSLYEKLPYNRVKKDIPMYYHNTGTFRTYHVVHKDGEIEKEYTSLYSENLEGMASFLGGGKGKTVVTSTASHDLRLLIIGDNTPLSFVPFLANHYGDITYINILGEDLNLENLQIQEFDQILFSVTAETYTTMALLPEEMDFYQEE